MKRILIMDILWMSILLFLSVNLANGQDTEVDEKPKNKIFGKIKTNGGGGPDDSHFCMSTNEDGEYCFSMNAYFSSLDFPCDLYAGISIDGISGTTFTSLSEVDYTYYAETDQDEAGYLGNVELGCFSMSSIYSAMGITSLFDDKDCYDNSLVRGYPETIGRIKITYEIYCKTDEGMIPVDYCKDYEEFEDVVYGSEEPIDDCSLGFSETIKICCEGINPNESASEGARVSLNESNTEIEVSFQNSEVIIEGVTTSQLYYQIFNLSGILMEKGSLSESQNTKIYSIRDVELDNGIYVLVINTGRNQYSQKFVSFR